MSTTFELSQDLIADVIAHLAAAPGSAAIVSETWKHAVEKRGDFLNAEELSHLFETGRRANAYFRNLEHYIDASILQPDDPIEKRLLEIGESPVGTPFHDACSGPYSTSSLFLLNVSTAAQIIKLFQRRGIARPRLMEIGGGLGTLSRLLKAYYGKDLTLYCVDLPEVLAMQEWYLRTTLPHESTLYHSGSKLQPVYGGINFIPATVIFDHDVHIDAVINIISMGEMKRSILQRYIAYAERNLSPSGFFLSWNGHAQTPEAAVNISEWEMDDRWAPTSVLFTSRKESMGWLELLRIVYERTPSSQSPTVRRFMLRVLLNGCQAGLFPRTTEIEGRLLQLFQSSSVEDAVAGVNRLLPAGSRYEPLVARLINERIWPPAMFGHASWRPEPLQFQAQEGRLMQHYALAQAELITAMSESDTLEEARAAVARVAVRCDTIQETITQSDYWTAGFASLLVPLAQSSVACALLKKRLDREPEPVWKLRYAHLFTLAGKAMDADAVLQSFPPQSLTWWLQLKYAELKGAVGSKESARQILETIAHLPYDYNKAPVVLKTAIRLGNYVLAENYLRGLTELRAPWLVTVLLDLARFMGKSDQRPFIDHVLQLLTDNLQAASPKWHVDNDIIRRKFDLQDGDGLLQSYIEEHWDDYYELGRLGASLHGSGEPVWAKKCLDRSYDVGPRDVRQLEFLGKVWLRADHPRRAQAFFQQATAQLPYILELQGHAAFASLSPELRAAGVFGQSSLLRMVFPREPDYYHDIGPQYMWH